jgi:hypothetical protein
MSSVFVSDTHLSLVQHPRLRPRANPRWREREHFRKDLYRLPYGWTALKLNPDHYVSVAEDRQKLTWFPDEKCGALDRRRIIDPADYLKRFHPDQDAEKLLLYLKPSGLKISETAEEARQVYMTPNMYQTMGHCSVSCMTRASDTDAYSPPGNCRVAYLVREDQTIIARSVVNIDTKKHANIYAPKDQEVRDQMTRALHSAGFSPGLNRSRRDENILASEITYADFSYIIYTDKASS